MLPSPGYVVVTQPVPVYLQEARGHQRNLTSVTVCAGYRLLLAFFIVKPFSFMVSNDVKKC